MKKTVCGVVFMLLLVSTLLSAFSSAHARNGYVLTSVGQPVASCFVLDQDFDGETVPENWTVTGQAVAYNFTIDETVYYGQSGKSAKSVVTEGFLNAHRNFTAQNGAIVVEFAVRVDNAIENSSFEVYVDDGNLTGASIIFAKDGIQYRDYGEVICLRYPYFTNRWYRIKLIMNIPDNVYNIHIDDHLEAINANFTGSCTQIHRIIVNETSSLSNYTAYIDQIKVSKCIEIPEDFPTIQEGVDAAYPGDTIFVKAGEVGKRVYFENVIINKSVSLIGEDMTTTIIDARFVKTSWRADGIYIKSCNVTVCGFTIKNAEADGICIEGSNNTINNNKISYNLDHGIYVNGSNNTLSENIINSHFECGIYVNGSNNLVKKNIIKDNEIGLQCIEGTKNNSIYKNRFICNTIQALDSGSNVWDNGYPYQPDEKGGGNYWSDHNSTDFCLGVNQDEYGILPVLSPLPDGICDKPYFIDPYRKDNYPLFIIQEVTQQPDADDVTYEDGVEVTVTVLRGVPVEEVKICVYVDSQFDGCIRAEQSRINQWEETIPRKKYCSEVTYYISIDAYCEEWTNSIIYPLPAWANATCYPSPYHVQDKKPPKFYRPGGAPAIVWSPLHPNEDDLIIVTARVYDDSRLKNNLLNLASGIDKVLLQYEVVLDEVVSWWTTDMTCIESNHPYYMYEAVIPRQPVETGARCTAYGEHGELHANVTIFDKAGNTNSQPIKWKGEDVVIESLAELCVGYSGNQTYVDPLIIDFGVLNIKQTKKDRNVKICNMGMEVLDWSVNKTHGGEWFIIRKRSNKKTSGITWPYDPEKTTHNCTSMEVIVNTNNWDPYDPCPPRCEAVVTANGSVPQWTIVIIFRVRHIIIDRSSASSEAPDRCDLNSTQSYKYHAAWNLGCVDATPGEINFSYLIPVRVCVGEGDNISIVIEERKKYFSVNVSETGWANFNITLGKVWNTTFVVEKVKFPYRYKGTDYYITRFSHDPDDGPNRQTIWDRVNITLSVIDDNDPPRMDVGTEAVVSWNGSKYEFDNAPFEGDVVELNDTLRHDTVGERCITTSEISDSKFNLTVFTSNTVCCIWDRIKIVGGCVSEQQTEEGQTENVWFTGIYEYDNVLFKGGEMGDLYVDVYEDCKVSIRDDPLVWSYDNERWEKQYFNTSGVRAYKVSKVRDNLYNLTEIVPQTTPKFQLTIMVEGNGTTDPIPGIYTYSDHIEVDVHAFPDPDWIIHHWLLDGVEVDDDDASESVTVRMNDDHVLTVFFEEVQRAELWGTTMGIFLMVVLMIAGFTSVILLIPKRNRLK